MWVAPERVKRHLITGWRLVTSTSRPQRREERRAWEREMTSICVHIWASPHLFSKDNLWRKISLQKNLPRSKSRITGSSNLQDMQKTAVTTRLAFNRSAPTLSMSRSLVWMVANRLLVGWGLIKFCLGAKRLGANRLEGWTTFFRGGTSRYTTHPKNKHSSSALRPWFGLCLNGPEHLKL